MPTITYTPIATITLATSASNITFTGLSGSFRDLVIIGDTYMSSGSMEIRYNADSGAFYPYVFLKAAGGIDSYNDTLTQISPTSGVGDSATSPTSFKMDVFDYAQTDKHKQAMIRIGRSDWTAIHTVRYAKTDAITSVSFIGGTYVAGSTISIYGVLA